MKENFKLRNYTSESTASSMSSEREVCPYITALPNLPSGQLSMCWGRGNHLLIHGTKFKHEGSVRPRQKNENELLYGIWWETSLYNSITRKLVNESVRSFLKLQKICAETSDSNNKKAQIITISRTYRSVIHECIHNLQEAAANTQDNDDKAAYEMQVQEFFQMELIWNLCEILLIDVPPGGALLIQLLEWIRWHFPDCEKQANEAMNAESPELHPNYWDAINGYILQGRIKDAIELLSVHSASSNPAFISLMELLRKMPLYTMFRGQSLGEFDLRWNYWQKECNRRLDEGEFSIHKNLEKICLILLGDRKMFGSLMTSCETWYHMLISRLFYTNPTVKRFDLRCMADECINMYGGSSQMTNLDRILLAVLEFDVLKVIQESSFNFDNWWFVAHLADLLHHCEQLEACNHSNSVSLREALLLDYAACLVTHHSLWQIAVNYYDNCPIRGRQHLEAYLECIPVDSEWKARKILSIAENRDMQALTHSICKVVATQALHNNNLGSALSWALKSKDSSFATYLADKFLMEYCNKGQFSNLDLLDNLGSCMLVSDRLTFLGKYREFQKLHEQRDFPKAASLLVSLLSSQLAPKYFWMTLLLDALPLLESNEIIFSSEQTYELLYFLDEINQYEIIKSKESTSEKEELLRLALARNLSRAILQEQSLE